MAALPTISLPQNLRTQRALVRVVEKAENGCPGPFQPVRYGSEPSARVLRRKIRDASCGSPRSLAAQRTLARDDNRLGDRSAPNYSLDTVSATRHALHALLEGTWPKLSRIISG